MGRLLRRRLPECPSCSNGLSLFRTRNLAARLGKRRDRSGRPRQSPTFVPEKIPTNQCLIGATWMNFPAYTQRALSVEVFSGKENNTEMPHVQVLRHGTGNMAQGKRRGILVHREYGRGDRDKAHGTLVPRQQVGGGLSVCSTE